MFVQLLSLCDPVNCSTPGFPVHGILQARVLGWAAMPSSRGSSQARDRTWVSGRFFTTRATWEAHRPFKVVFICNFPSMVKGDWIFKPGVVYFFYTFANVGLPTWFSGKESACQCRSCGFDPWVRKIPWRRAWQPTPVFWRIPGQRSLVGCSPWGHKESDTAEVTEHALTQDC